jgi:hypothetical protein
MEVHQKEHAVKVMKELRKKNVVKRNKFIL